MMEKLHQVASSWLLKVLLLLLIFSLLLTTGFSVVDHWLAKRRGYVAVVNGEKIERAYFTRAYHEQQSRMQDRWGSGPDKLSTEQISSMKHQLLKEMIESLLFGQYAEKLGLRVGDEQIKAQIRSMDAFQKDGKFSNERFLRLLEKSSISSNLFGQLIRKGMLRQQLYFGLIESEFVLPEESKQLHSILTQKREVRCAPLDVDSMLPEQNVSDAQAEEYYTTHPGRFKLPEMVRVNYITMSAAALQPHIKVSKSEIEHFYKKNSERYTLAERRHISLIRLDSAAKAKNILQQLNKSPKVFARLAREESTDKLTSSRGGVLGWIEAGTTDPAIDKAAFAMRKSGEISDVIALEGQGFYLLRLNKVEPRRLKDLKEASDDIALELRSNKALAEFSAQRNRVAAALDNGVQGGWEEIEKISGVKVEHSLLFSRDRVPSDLDYPDLVRAIFNPSFIESGEYSEPIEIGGERAYILQVIEHQPEVLQPFDKVKEDARFLQRRELAAEAARLKAEIILSGMRSGKSDEVLKASGMRWEESMVLDRLGKSNRTLSEAVFSHPRPKEGHPSYGINVGSKGEVLIFELLAVINPPASESEMNEFDESYFEQSKMTTSINLMSALRRDAKIKQANLDIIE